MQFTTHRQRKKKRGVVSEAEWNPRADSCVAQPFEVQCIAPGVLRSFLMDKWIPPRDPLVRRSIHQHWGGF